MPKKIFSDPTSTVITSSNNTLIGAKIADDGQWRFPSNDTIPEKLKTCILLFEDEHFYKHPGFNPFSIANAIQKNIRSGQIKRGGSTISQQVIRLSRKGKKRTYTEKLKELILATRLEFKFSKTEILNLYINNAPYGGNVVGANAAAWRYFNTDLSRLSWAQNATLAVLPNAPSLIHPGKNRIQLLKKRNNLLRKLLKKEIIDTLTYEVSIAENLPEKPYSLPQTTPHLLHRIAKTNKGKFVKTTINYNLQQQINSLVKTHYNELKQNEIHNAAVLVLDVNTKHVLAYIGNTPTTKTHQKHVDIISKGRSTGSILKPFLYAAMLDNGAILPKTLIPDIPSQFGNYQPENFNKTFQGAVHANEALAQSLNVPAVLMLKDFGITKFHHYLKQLKLSNVNKSPEHYGLSLILGGAESNLWDLCRSYGGLALTLNRFNNNSSQYFSSSYNDPIINYNDTFDIGKPSFEKHIFGAGAIYHTLNSLKQVNRPEDDESWLYFNSSQDIAWKTGTSFGFRDAWAIGVTKNYVVGVWIGNADGEGRPGLIGTQTAGPLLFDVFNLLPKSRWFDIPFDDLVPINVCKDSGYKASQYSINTEEMYVPIKGEESPVSPFHKLLHLDYSENFQVNSECKPISEITHKSWFILPPKQAFYYKKNHPEYKEPPAFHPDCTTDSENKMAFIYPKSGTTIFLPKDFNNKKNDVIVHLAHSNPNTTVHWYLNNTFLGSTTQIHQYAIQPKVGNHTVTVVDDLGESLSCKITISE